MKNIIKNIFGAKEAQKPSIPTAWMTQLVEMDDIAALELSAHQLSQILNRNDNEVAFNLQQELDFILALEAQNHPRLERLASQFAKVENLKADLANNICEASYQYCRLSYVYHLKLVEKIFTIQKQSEHYVEVDAKTTCLMIARALNAAFNMVKWRLFTNTSPPASVWLQTFVLYRIAAQKSLTNHSVEVFALCPRTTLAGHFVQVWMLGQLSQANLLKAHIEIACQILTTLVVRALISTKYSPEQYTFYIDLKKDAHAKRIRNFEPNEHCRYWDLAELEKQLGIILTASARGEIPQSLALLTISNTKKLNETAGILISEWQKTGYVRQRRISTRHASSKSARAHSGIVEICKQVLQTNKSGKDIGVSRDGKSFDERLRAHTILRDSSDFSANSDTLDDWIITDESDHGLGARISKSSNLSARPDNLISLVMSDDPQNIIIGMIRSVRPTQGDKLRVGVEIISRHPMQVQLQQTNDVVFAGSKTEIEPQLGNNSNNTNVDIGLFSAIYLPIEAGRSTVSALILPKIDFRPNAKYMVNIAGTQKHVLLGQAIESRDDWVKVAFPF